jgi:hypothetical protein
MKTHGQLRPQWIIFSHLFVPTMNYLESLISIPKMRVWARQQLLGTNSAWLDLFIYRSISKRMIHMLHWRLHLADFFYLYIISLSILKKIRRISNLAKLYYNRRTPWRHRCGPRRLVMAYGGRVSTFSKNCNFFEWTRMKINFIWNL